MYFGWINTFSVGCCQLNQSAENTTIWSMALKTMPAK